MEAAPLKLELMQLCAITDRRALGADEKDRATRLVELAASWARGGIDYIQVREKDLNPAGLAALAHRIVVAVKQHRSLVYPLPVWSSRTRVIVNGSAAVALAAGADGVHIPGSLREGAVDEVRDCFAPQLAIVSVACHSLAEVERARSEGADLILFAPVFEKSIDSVTTLPGLGVTSLAEACRIAGDIPVFALGGVTVANAHACIEAGADGVAGIRLFMEADEWLSLR